MQTKHEVAQQSQDRGVGGCWCINNHIKNIRYISKTSDWFHRIHKTTIKINIIDCTMEVSDDSINDGTGVFQLAKQYTADTLRSGGSGQKPMKSRRRVTAHIRLGVKYLYVKYH